MTSFPKLDTDTLGITLSILAQKFHAFDDSIGLLLGEYEDAIKPFPHDLYMNASPDEAKRIESKYENDSEFQKKKKAFQCCVVEYFTPILEFRKQLMDLLASFDYEQQFKNLDTHIQLLEAQIQAARKPDTSS